MPGNIFSKPSRQQKSFSFTTQGIGAGIYYKAGYYEAPLADLELNQGAANFTYGGADVPHAAHAFIVASGAGTASGGAGLVTIKVTGTSINDSGVRTPADSETLTLDITTLTTDLYLETSKKWVGAATFVIDPGVTGHTAYAATFNYGLCKYEDFGNIDFCLTDFELVGLAQGNDALFNVELIKHQSTGWVYSAAAFVPGATPLLDMRATHGTESDLDSGDYFAFKRTGLVTRVDGADSEGLVVRITTGINNAVQSMDIHIGVDF